MRLEPIYRLAFRYPEAFKTERGRFLLAEGRAEGRVGGRFRGANTARRESDGYVPDLSGAIATDDGATILLRLGGYGLPRAEPQGRVVAWMTHDTDDERYGWLDGVVCAVAGEVHGRDVLLDVAELVWEPLNYHVSDEA